MLNELDIPNSDNARFNENEGNGRVPYNSLPESFHPDRYAGKDELALSKHPFDDPMGPKIYFLAVCE